ncbi:Uncharacterised protein [Vibrio cholerae]|nr:Uncharacterised protein [Vibrio cholerae]CSC03705.1 Uncharacterised protein [Vibrio cholerae]CSD01015.1 Uncharacterised protein [Vibrio cholerae]CSD22386.1 Uncharacterised protein [Vibrio cholerae]CSI67680.1 Uncharacterised protein [Vibrio cholerae]
MAQSKADIKTAQSNSFEQLINMGKFGFFGAQKFTPCRGIEKEIQHFHSRTHGVSRGL